MHSSIKNILWILEIITVVSSMTYAQKQIYHIDDKDLVDIQFGAASSAYQIEGGWNEDGKGASIWDTFVHDANERIRDGTTGDVTSDSYHNLERDLDMLSELGVDHYRFSIAWSRILPNGFSNKINEAGIKYYSDLIDGLIKRNITPMITMYHWDLPQVLQDLGGWANEKIVDYFEDYARVLFDNYGSRVSIWITVNEPDHVCIRGYGTIENAPIQSIPGIGEYLCMHNIHKTHARVYHTYKNEYADKFDAKFGLAVFLQYVYPKTETTVDRKAASLFTQMFAGWQLGPVYGEHGDYPHSLKHRVAFVSKLGNFSHSRMPEFTPEEIEYIRGTADFMGINYYFPKLGHVSDDIKAIEQPGFYNDMGVELTYDTENWIKTPAKWIFNKPEALRSLLNFIKNTYNNPIVIITENGATSRPNEIENTQTVHYIHNHIEAVFKAIKEDGCNVIAYTVWSLMDNYEWNFGMTEKFGLFQLDFNDPKKPATARASAKYYADVIARVKQNVRKTQFQIITLEDGSSFEIPEQELYSMKALALVRALRNTQARSEHFSETNGAMGTYGIDKFSVMFAAGIILGSKYLVGMR